MKAYISIIISLNNIAISRKHISSNNVNGISINIKEAAISSIGGILRAASPRALRISRIAQRMAWHGSINAAINTQRSKIL